MEMKLMIAIARLLFSIIFCIMSAALFFYLLTRYIKRNPGRYIALLDSALYVCSLIFLVALLLVVIRYA